MSSLGQLWDTTRMRLLVELERGGSLSAAARAAHISQPTASQHLRLLETAAGQPLVDRGGRRLRLTEAGRVLASRAAHALATLEEADDELASLAGLRTGTIRLGAATTPGAYVLPDTLACFARSFPDVVVELQVSSSADVLQRLLDGRVQLAIVGGESAGNGRVVAEPFLDDELVGISAPGTVSADGGIVDSAVVGAHRLLAREPGSGTQEHVDAALAGLGIAPASRWEIGSTEAIKRAAREGLGIAFVSLHAVREELDHGTLAGFALRDAPLRRTLHLVRIAGRPVPPAERSFVETLTRCCAEHHADACLPCPPAPDA